MTKPTNKSSNNNNNKVVIMTQQQPHQQQPFEIISNDDDNNDNDFQYYDNDDNDDDHYHRVAPTMIHNDSDDNYDDHNNNDGLYHNQHNHQQPNQQQNQYKLLYEWNDPWLPSIIITIVFNIPILIGNILFLYHMFGRIYFVLLYSVHLLLSIYSIYAYCFTFILILIKYDNINNANNDDTDNIAFTFTNSTKTAAATIINNHDDDDDQLHHDEYNINNFNIDSDDDDDDEHDHSSSFLPNDNDYDNVTEEHHISLSPNKMTANSINDTNSNCNNNDIITISTTTRTVLKKNRYHYSLSLLSSFCCRYCCWNYYNNNDYNPIHYCRIISTLSSFFDIILFGYVYPMIYSAFMNVFFQDADGTIAIEWYNSYQTLYHYQIFGYIIVTLRIFFGIITWCIRYKDFIAYYIPELYMRTTSYQYQQQNQVDNNNTVLPTSSSFNMSTTSYNHNNINPLSKFILYCQRCLYTIILMILRIVLLLPFVCIERFVIMTKCYMKQTSSSLYHNNNNSNRRRLCCLRYILRLILILSCLFVLLCFISFIEHIILYWPKNPPIPNQYITNHNNQYQHHSKHYHKYHIFSWWYKKSSSSPSSLLCDSIDNTECWLPFPSFHHCIVDQTTITGYRVNIQWNILPPLKGNIPLNLYPNQFVNQLDGFSTMAPILFYINKYKESHEYMKTIMMTTPSKTTISNNTMINHNETINTLLQNTTVSTTNDDNSDTIAHNNMLNIIQRQPQLQGPTNILKSITNESITLLFDVIEHVLIPHHAEIDYLDDQHPMIMIFPSKPLKHSNHYGVAIINAYNPFQQQRYQPTIDMKQLLSATSSTMLTKEEQHKKERYANVLIPALEIAAPWLQLNWNNTDEENIIIDNYDASYDTLQLLFDFPTISEESQLGLVRQVRDATLSYFTSTTNNQTTDDDNDDINNSTGTYSSVGWNWMDHVRTNQIIDRQCIFSKKDTKQKKTNDHDAHDDDNNDNYIARTVHAEMDVPWFLSNSGPGYRQSLLNHHAVQTGVPVQLGVAKFVVHIPCSVKNAASLSISTSWSLLNNHSSNKNDKMMDDTKPIRAIMEFGHGLFGNRNEASDQFLSKMAHDEGYVIIAMDWRGMSVNDLPIVIKTLVCDPTLFEVVRDNLIQGYANKFSLLHFAKHDMLSMDWFKFLIPTNMMVQHHDSLNDGENDMISYTDIVDAVDRSNDDDANNNMYYATAPTYNNEKPTIVFYGISQGGILGAGYSALSGVTNLIQYSILGVPGTPFALIMSRSLDFRIYDQLFMYNFYNNRQVRVILSIAQMMWDTVEGSGVLAEPITEPYYPRTLLQAGVGDAIVSSLAAEALARTYNASILLPSHPYSDSIYGVPGFWNDNENENNNNNNNMTGLVINHNLTSSVNKTLDNVHNGDIKYWNSSSNSLNLPDNQNGIGSTKENGHIPPHVVLTELLYEKEYSVMSKDTNQYSLPNDIHFCVRKDPALIRQIKIFINTGEIINPCIDDQCIRTQSHC